MNEALRLLRSPRILGTGVIVYATMAVGTYMYARSKKEEESIDVLEALV